MPKHLGGGRLDGFQIVQGKLAPVVTESYATHLGQWAEGQQSKVVEREEPQDFDEISAEVDARVEALKRGRTQWGCAGQHHGHYTPNQIDRGAPNCPRTLHHHHDAFCAEPSKLELRLAGVTKPADGWGSRA